MYQIQKRQSSGSMDDRPLMWVKDYVESLHQNSRATLLFGKNNVLVQPVRVFVKWCPDGSFKVTFSEYRLCASPHCLDTLTIFV